MNKDCPLQLTSMMDILVIIVVFLLKSYNCSSNSFTSAPGLQLPTSASDDSPNDSLQVVITPESITVDNQRVLDFVQMAANAGSTEAKYTFKPNDLDESGLRVVPLYDALMKARERTEILQAKSSARTPDGKPLPFEGMMALQADKKIRYDILKKIMYTAGSAGYKVVRFLAMKKDT